MKKTLRNIVIYVAGPYRADTIYKIKKNIEKAEETAMELWKAGFSVICPHKNTAFFDGELSDDSWMIGGLEVLHRCNALFLMGDWEYSKGSIKEEKYAVENGIPIFHNVSHAVDYFKERVNGE